MSTEDDEAGAAPDGTRSDESGAAPDGTRSDESGAARAGTGTGPDDDAVAPDDARQRRRARIVTFAVVGVIVLGALAEVEAWPVTAFRLFSSVRTDTTSSLQLVVVHPDGSTAPLALQPANDVVVITGHQFATLRDLPPDRQRAKVDAWLDLAGVDRADVASVRLDRVTFHYDADAGRLVETKRTHVTEVTP
jgi:hypothetical protein